MYQHYIGILVYLVMLRSHHERDVLVLAIQIECHLTSLQCEGILPCLMSTHLYRCHWVIALLADRLQCLGHIYRNLSKGSDAQ